MVLSRIEPRCRPSFTEQGERTSTAPEGRPASRPSSAAGGCGRRRGPADATRVLACRVMKRRDFIAGGIASAAPSLCAQNATTQRRPNILFVFADQLRAQSVGCYGNSEVRTPHTDKLASEGVLFRNT